jgi:hypothetical protein
MRAEEELLGLGEVIIRHDVDHDGGFGMGVVLWDGRRFAIYGPEDTAEERERMASQLLAWVSERADPNDAAS